MRAVVVTRVSTADQAEKGTSLDGQRERLTAYAASRGWDLVEICTDAGISGSRHDRPGLTRALELIHDNRADVLLGTKLDRVSRSALGLLELIEDLTRHNAALVVVDDGLDTSTDTGKLVASILGIIAGFERDRIRSRTVEGRSRAAAAGRFVGSTPPLGYRVAEHPSGTGRTLEIDPDESRSIRHLYEQYVVAGQPASAIASDLNRRGWLRRGGGTWTAQHVSQWCTRRGSVETWAGAWHFQDTPIDIPAILTAREAETWSDWQSSRRWAKPASGNYALSGVIVMPCGGNAQGRKAGNRAATYSCPGRLTGQAGHEHCHNLRMTSTDEAVRTAIANALTGEGALDKLRTAVADRLSDEADHGAALAELHQQAADLDAEVAEQFTSLREAGLRRQAITAALRPLVQRQDELARSIASTKRALGKQKTRAVDIDAAVESVRSVLNQPLDTAILQWRQILHALDVRVTVTDHTQCTNCAGGGRMPATGQPRGWTPRCTICLRGSLPVLRLEMDNALALAVMTQVAV